jgi:uncharacterized phage infection (PIP) family protein YhgE
MTMLANRDESRALTLADYEARIHLYKEQIGTGYIGIGRTLNEAKEAKVVPHGQWETWVTETTGLTPRQAQRCMQAATEIRDGSALARLEMSKALMLLGSGLDEEAREEIAQKAADEGATVKALREEVRQAKLKLVQETGAASEIRDALKKAEKEREHLEQQLKATISAYQTRLDEETEKAYQQGQDDTVNMHLELQQRINMLEIQRDEAYQRGEKAGAAEAVKDAKKEAFGLRNELVKQTQYAEDLKRNQADLLAAAEEAEKRAADAEAELEALRAGQGTARKTAADIVEGAITALISECAMIPFNGEELTRERVRVIGCLASLEDWVDKMYAAIGEIVPAEGAIE